MAPISNRPTVEWMWQTVSNSSKSSGSIGWTKFSDIENHIIEDAYAAHKTEVILDDCRLNLKTRTHISNNNTGTKRSIKRVVLEQNQRPIREERYTFDPIAPLIVELACYGIIYEGKLNERQHEAEWMATMLMTCKYKTIEEIWICCAYLYTMESFLYKRLNETMRAIGDNTHEQYWRSKVSTLGPFALLLWDDPSNIKPKTSKYSLYRGATLSSEQIAMYKECCKRPNDYQSFQAFTSSSRNRDRAEKFGNALFTMKVHYAFTADVQMISDYCEEEEELIFPGVCFTVEKFTYDTKKNKHLIYLKLKQRFNG